MGCWGITAFESDEGLDTVSVIRHTLPEDGKMELRRLLELLKLEDGCVPDVSQARSHSGPVVLAETITMLLDGNFDHLDYDWDDEDRKFKDLSSFTATKEPLQWIRDYVAETLRVRVACAAAVTKEEDEADTDFRPSWSGWRKEADWLAWRAYMNRLVARLDTLLALPEENIQLLKAER